MKKYIRIIAVMLVVFALTLMGCGPNKNKEVNITALQSKITLNVDEVLDFNYKSLFTIKEGTIEKIIQSNTNGDKRIIGFEYCKSIAKNKLFSGSSNESMINNGAWESDLYLKLEKNFRDYENLYSILVDGDTFRFMIYLLKDTENNGYCVYIAPTNKTEHPRILTTKFSTNMLETNYFLDNENEKMILKLLKTNHCAYANNLTGTDFWNVMAMGNFI